MKLNDFTFVVPFSIDSEIRELNLSNCLKYFAHTGANFCLVSDSHHSKAEKIIIDAIPENLNPLFFTVPRLIPDAFHKTFLVNQGLREVKTPFFGILDCDVICPYNNLVIAATHLRNDETDFVYPYDGRFVDVPREYVQGFLDRTLKSAPFKLLHHASCGGLILGKTEIYRAIGGENENFISWGPEDMERHNRIVKTGHRLARIPVGPIYHMEHPRDHNGGESNPHFQKNTAEYVRLAGLNKDQLFAEISTWEWKR